jgi:hypothetical protein
MGVTADMTRLFLLLLLTAGLVAPAASQGQSEDDPWKPIRFLEGSWTGTAEGRFGSGTVERAYSFEMDGAYLHERHVSDYPPQERNPEGELHEYWSFFSYDRARGLLVYRQFHDEGIINQFVLNEDLTKDDLVVFDTESIENFGEGWRARETYRVISNDEFVEQFYLAAPGKEYDLYNTNRFRRAS